MKKRVKALISVEPNTGQINENGDILAAGRLIKNF
jgi:hypothetical protein